MYQVIMERYTPTNVDDIRPVVVWEGSRIKEARGQLRHQIKDTFKSLEKHDFYNAHDFYVDTVIGTIKLFDKNYNWTLYIHFYMKEVI